MTPRTMENSLNQVFSNLIMLQRNEDLDPFDLRENAPIMKPLHPKMVMGLLEFMNNPEQEVNTPGCYATVLEAQKDFPSFQVVKGLPYAVHAHLKSNAIIDFSPFGAAVITGEKPNKQGTPGVHQYILPPLLEYALSNELWGQQGKWTRFHERLNILFDKYQLLNGKSAPGRYPLKAIASKLEKRGIKGDLTGDTYVLTFPWTFPLTALSKLEGIFQEEF